MPSRRKSKRQGSSTPGRMKGENCQRSQLKNLFCNDTRLHRTNPKLWLKCCEEVQKIQKSKGNNATLSEFVKRDE